MRVRVTGCENLESDIKVCNDTDIALSVHRLRKKYTLGGEKENIRSLSKKLT